jgi:Mg2+/Co2+ transporter CorB
MMMMTTMMIIIIIIIIMVVVFFCCSKKNFHVLLRSVKKMGKKIARKISTLRIRREAVWWSNVVEVVGSI